ncbi:matrix metalloproteinase [Nesidiocoris tenuis]|uniref:Matrix metalloproteinase n=1 Tax=Nesidiocoris tenuis TaxID=355587 RepID=A0ABN7ASE2_9HEMI|nr:matrix metalloproteinase [Nesidiocoris tenuis]
MLRERFFSLLLIAAAVARVDRKVPIPSPLISTAPQSIEFLKKYGYLAGSSGGDLEALYDEKSVESAIREAQVFGGLKQTGILDKDTLKLFGSKRCGLPDVLRNGSSFFGQADHEHNNDLRHHHHHHDRKPLHDERHRRSKRFVLSGTSWKKRHLKYYIANTPAAIPDDVVSREIQTALNKWGDYGNLRFSRTDDPIKAEISMGFYSGQHGDPSPFDGRGNVLAHAFYPMPQAGWGLGGDIHFDSDENWSVGPTNDPFKDTVDFPTVALHEMGHSLGLMHSAKPGSVMNPYYTGRNALGDDDVRAMYDLYASKNLESIHPTVEEERRRQDERRRNEEEWRRREYEARTQEERRKHEERRRTEERQNDDASQTSEEDKRREEFRRRKAEEDRKEQERKNREEERRREQAKWEEDKRRYELEVERRRQEEKLIQERRQEARRQEEMRRRYEEERRRREEERRRMGFSTTPSGTTGPPTTRKPTSVASGSNARDEDDGCTGKFDTVAYLRGEIFITKGKMLWRLSGPGRVQNGYPAEIRQFFHLLPDDVTKIDSMYQRERDSSLIMFSGRSYWVFDGYVFSGPRPIRDYGLTEDVSRVDAVTSRNGTVLVFSGGRYWKVDGSRVPLSQRTTPQPISAALSGLPDSLDAALDYKGVTYFFKDDRFWAMERESNSPMLQRDRASDFWLRC